MDIPGCAKARSYKRIWLYSKKGKNFKVEWNMGREVGSNRKKIWQDGLTTDWKGFQMQFKVVWILSLGK